MLFSKFYSFVFGASSIVSLIYLMVMKGVPQPTSSTTGTLTDPVFQPFLAALWGIVGYFFNSVVVGLLVVLAIGMIHITLDFFFNRRNHVQN